jgi:hypothetical protein
VVKTQHQKLLQIAQQLVDVAVEQHRRLEVVEGVIGVVGTGGSEEKSPKCVSSQTEDCSRQTGCANGQGQGTNMSSPEPNMDTTSANTVATACRLENDQQGQTKLAELAINESDHVKKQPSRRGIGLCPSPAGEMRQTGPHGIPKAKAGQDPQTVRCFSCRQKGHFWRNCPQEIFQTRRPVKTAAVGAFVANLGAAANTHGMQANAVPTKWLDIPPASAMLQVLIGTLLVFAKLDSGARTSSISGATARRLGLVGGNAGRIRGKQHSVHTLFNVSVGGVTIPIPMRVVNDLRADCILGVDFLEKSGAVMDYSNRCTWVGGAAIPWATTAPHSAHGTTAGTPSGRARVAC